MKHNLRFLPAVLTAFAAFSLGAFADEPAAPETAASAVEEAAAPAQSTVEAVVDAARDTVETLVGAEVDVPAEEAAAETEEAAEETAEAVAGKLSSFTEFGAPLLKKASDDLSALAAEAEQPEFKPWRTMLRHLAAMHEAALYENPTSPAPYRSCARRP